MQDVERITEQNQERVRFAREMDWEFRRRNYLEVKREKELRRQEMEQKIRRGVTMAVWAMIGAGVALAGVSVHVQAWGLMTAAGVWFALAAIAAMFAGKDEA